ncbi:TMEM165/GDT1 family protein [Lysobacter sp. N42]|nr:TMEM165/GDT1 family protein [Lysobacter sp. N42]
MRVASPCLPGRGPAVSALLVSTATVALAEIGDKTQLLALLLAARYRRPGPIIAGILFATVANHALAAWLGHWISTLVSPQAMRWLVAASFAAVALWTLRPDRLDGDDAPRSNGSAFLAALVAFFLAETGDKTQVATVLLATRFDALVQVILGTTLGMLVANVPVVLLGHRFAYRLPLRAARWTAAAVFAALAAWVAVRGIS